MMALDYNLLVNQHSFAVGLGIYCISDLYMCYHKFAFIHVP